MAIGNQPSVILILLPDYLGGGYAEGLDRHQFWESTDMGLHKIWIEQCEAARSIEDEFGTQQALKYLVGEKFPNYLEAAGGASAFRAEIPAFVENIKTIFEPWQLAEYLKTARETEPFDPVDYEDDEAEMERQADIRRCAADLLLTERAIHFRSASRVGYSDLGVNRHRMEQIQKGFSE